MTTLETLRAQALEPLTAKQLIKISDAVLVAFGHTITSVWIDLSGQEWPLWKRPNPAASIDDAAALMPKGYLWQIAYNPVHEEVSARSGPGKRWEKARTEAYARMLAAVAAHLELAATVEEKQ